MRHTFAISLILTLSIALPSFCSDFSKETQLVDDRKTICQPFVLYRISREVLLSKHPGAFSDNEINQSGWAKHPVRNGALIGFGAGFVIGVAAGDNGFPFEDANKWGNGVILGGIGAAVGALLTKALAQ